MAKKCPMCFSEDLDWRNPKNKTIYYKCLDCEYTWSEKVEHKKILPKDIGFHTYKRGKQ